MKKLIKIIGGNATGKSTRILKYVESRGDTYQEIEYTWNSITKNTPEGKITTQIVGRLYPNGTFVMGKLTKGGNWVGADEVLGKTGNKEAHYEMLHWLLDNHKINSIVIEGYFAVGGGSIHIIKNARRRTV